MKEKVFLGFDFSMNKPACCMLFRNEFTFFVWPLSIKQKLEDEYKNEGIQIYNRNLESLDKHKSSNVVIVHTLRAIDLANIILESIESYIKDRNCENYDIMMANEGLSMNSKGSSALDLASYKSIFLSKFIEKYGSEQIYTYSPMTIKKVAGCSKKNEAGEKVPVIEAFINNELTQNIQLVKNLKEGNHKKKKNYDMCIDDIADSFFCLYTMMKDKNIELQ